MSEIWKPVVGFEDYYEVSDQGRVRSLDRVIAHSRGGTRVWKGRVLREWVNGKLGHVAVAFSVRGVRYVRLVHRLVCTAFHGVPPKGKEVAHSNGVPNDNRAANLSWKTRSENHADKRIHGTMICGEKHPCAILTEKQVRRIRALFAKGLKNTAIVQLVGGTISAVCQVVARRSWKHV